VTAAVDERLAQYAPLIQLLRDCRLGLSAARASRILGCGTPEHLDRWMRLNGLPPFALFRNWIYVILLLQQDRNGLPLAHWALNRADDPAVYYRFVLRVTSRTWGSLKKLGWEWAASAAVHIWSPFLSAESRAWLAAEEILAC
jgi:hypothetical protein